MTKNTKVVKASMKASTKKAVWLGAQILMSKPATEEKQKEQQLILAA